MVTAQQKQQPSPPLQETTKQPGPLTPEPLEPSFIDTTLSHWCITPSVVWTLLPHTHSHSGLFILLQALWIRSAVQQKGCRGFFGGPGFPH